MHHAFQQIIKSGDGVISRDDALKVDPSRLEASVRDYFGKEGRQIPAEASRLLKRLVSANENHAAEADRANRDMLEVVAVSEAEDPVGM